ncbi:DNA alkylation repair protein [Exiguobacterium aurantiacum]|uniref:DNA alkylation repair protein n=1 Tax=Exiguobacterium aurantiacum TaxID=33987 RepID=A0ABY5FRP3_9BACL|nr:DNA alkylation repair protein [Exiguobacterium aurantiacum]UTT44263.1 DNA alkylation repair protein [Exiguobacterium aurantiacum]
MATPLKDVYHEDFLWEFGRRIQSVYPSFEIQAFVASIVDESWEALALKARTRRISTILGEYLPQHYESALDVLVEIADDCVGFPYLFFPDFVVVYGQAEEHWERSMSALELFTQKSSSEFAIRPFLLRDSTRVLDRMMAWAEHPNEHVRRLASEGCRPRLPWAESLPMFKGDPGPVLAVLELLKEDPSLYVRKSVANNLNDISKDHPEAVLAVSRRWQGEHPHTDWIIRHGCRTLIKSAHPDALTLFGYAQDTDLTVNSSISIHPNVLHIGEACEIQYELSIRPGDAAYIRIEYAIDFINANGKASRKAFLLANKIVAGGARLASSRVHNWSDLTTRRHYPGEHRIVLLVNGREVAEHHIMLHKRDD